jgi:murein DD-endopeptidase MepM/ murein hydrolase activator NlpD
MPAVALLATALVTASALPAAAAATAAAVTGSAIVPVGVAPAVVASTAAPPDLSERGWRWPVAPVRITEPYRAPAHAYGPGHRGIDLAAAAGTSVVAPAAGVVAFAGQVAGRGVLTIDHGDGLVTTLEPVEAVLVAGTPVARGDAVASAAVGGHTVAGGVHFGVRWNGEYINPLLLLGGIPRAVLLPCC